MKFQNNRFIEQVLIFFIIWALSGCTSSMSEYLPPLRGAIEGNRINLKNVSKNTRVGLVGATIPDQPIPYFLSIPFLPVGHFAVAPFPETLGLRHAEDDEQRVENPVIRFHQQWLQALDTELQRQSGPHFEYVSLPQLSLNELGDDKQFVERLVKENRLDILIQTMVYGGPYRRAADSVRWNIPFGPPLYLRILNKDFKTLVTFRVWNQASFGHLSQETMEKEVQQSSGRRLIEALAKADIQDFLLLWQGQLLDSTIVPPLIRFSSPL